MARPSRMLAPLAVARGCQRSRLEEQFWAQAYERLVPMLTRCVAKPKATHAPAAVHRNAAAASHADKANASADAAALRYSLGASNTAAVGDAAALGHDPTAAANATHPNATHPNATHANATTTTTRAA